MNVPRYQKCASRRLVVALSLLAAVACNKSSASGEAASSRPKVAFLLSTLQEERYQKDQRYFEAAARQQGLSAFTFSADNDNAKQLAQVEDALSRGARVLVIQPTDSAAAAAYVPLAHERGAKVVAYDRGIAGGAVDYAVSHDSYRVGTLSAETALRATGGKGNYVLLNGQGGHSVALEIERGYMDVLRPYVERGDVHIVVERNHDSWSPEQALRTMEDAITKTKGDLQAVLANNSGMARGAVQAIEAGGLAGKHIFIAGADADAANVNFVCEGKQSIEILKDIRPLAEKAAEVAAALAKGAPVASTRPPESGKPPTAAVEVVVVTAENARKLVVDSGFHDAKDLPACTR